MKIAVSASGTNLDTQVDPRFGRCLYFVIFDLETGEFKAMNNSNQMEAGGAGISTAQVIIDQGVQAILTGNCGPNAYQVLTSAGVQVITGISGSVGNAIQDYRSGKCTYSSKASVPHHFGSRRNIGARNRMGHYIAKGQ